MLKASRKQKPEPAQTHHRPTALSEVKLKAHVNRCRSLPLKTYPTAQKLSKSDAGNCASKKTVRLK